MFYGIKRGYNATPQKKRVSMNQNKIPAIEKEGGWEGHAHKARKETEANRHKVGTSGPARAHTHTRQTCGKNV